MPHNKGFIAMLTLAWLSGCGGGGNSSSQQNSVTNSGNFADAPAPVSATSSQYASADIVLSWEIPVTRVDGNPLAVGEIGGYEISYLDAQGKQTIIAINEADTTEYMLTALSPSNYRFNIFSYDTSNRLSEPSITAVLPIHAFPVK